MTTFISPEETPTLPQLRCRFTPHLNSMVQSSVAAPVVLGHLELVELASSALTKTASRFCCRKAEKSELWPTSHWSLS